MFLLTWDRMYQSLIMARVSTYGEQLLVVLCSLHNNERAIPENIYIYIYSRNNFQWNHKAC